MQKKVEGSVSILEEDSLKRGGGGGGWCALQWDGRQNVHDGNHRKNVSCVQLQLAPDLKFLAHPNLWLMYVEFSYNLYAQVVKSGERRVISPSSVIVATLNQYASQPPPGPRLRVDQ